MEPVGPGTSGSGDGEIEALRREIALLRDQFRTVSDLGMRLASELDPSALLPAIVTEARKFTRSEAGSLYVRRDGELVFSVAQNDVLDKEHGGAAELPDIRLPVDGSSLAGLAASEKRTLNIEDVRSHPSWSTRSRDEFGYEVISMLVVPMVDHRSEVLGVLQLMNAREEDGRIAVYSEREAYLSGVLASHAATAMEIAALYSELEKVFESLVHYSTAAIDARDPCTSGHSSRVGSFAPQIATELGGFSSTELREIRFAGIFHDIGKIGVRERVLTKSDKIEPEGMEALAARFAAAAEATVRQGDATARTEGPGAAEAALATVGALMEELEFVRRINVPSWLSDDDLRRLDALRERTYRDWAGREVHLLTAGEHEKLCVRKGNLTASERREIEKHVDLGWKFLKKIPFPRDLARIPEYVYCHHEKLDGSGYPNHLAGEQLSTVARILAVADVFDALTASDRPYKKAIPPSRAVEIIEKECELGSWDPTVVAALRRLVEAGRLIPPRRATATSDAPLAAHDIW